MIRSSSNNVGVENNEIDFLIPFTVSTISRGLVHPLYLYMFCLFTKNVIASLLDPCIISLSCSTSWLGWLVMPWKWFHLLLRFHQARQKKS